MTIHRVVSEDADVASRAEICSCGKLGPADRQESPPAWHLRGRELGFASCRPTIACRLGLAIRRRLEPAWMDLEATERGRGVVAAIHHGLNGVP